MDRSFNSAADNDVGAVCANHFECISDRFGTGSACTYRRVNPSLCLQLQPNICSRAIRHQHWNGMRANTARTLLLQIIVLIKQRDDSTDTGCDNYAKALLINFRSSSIFPRFTGCNESKLFRAIKATHLNALHLIGRFCMNTSGEVHRQ